MLSAFLAELFQIKLVTIGPLDITECVVVIALAVFALETNEGVLAHRVTLNVIRPKRTALSTICPDGPSKSTDWRPLPIHRPFAG
jgi:hypothetical protein